MAGVTDRAARFCCTMVLARGGRAVADFTGTVEGRIGHQQAGQGGFGYDPLFIPAGHRQTFAELGEAVKNSMSHRARALQQAVNWLASPAATGTAPDEATG
jgi:XTP/dITP diphosphohydrolase